MERLELLGDSVLKYTTSCHLFLKYPKKHEGQLSGQRSRAVSNSTLHRLAIERKIQVTSFFVSETSLGSYKLLHDLGRTSLSCCLYFIFTGESPRFFVMDINRYDSWSIK